jgi:hypothetical protein
MVFHSGSARPYLVLFVYLLYMNFILCELCALCGKNPCRRKAEK